MTWTDLDQLISSGSSVDGRKGYDGNEKKQSILFDGRRYMLKIQNKLESSQKDGLRASYSNSPFSEYVSCHIAESCGLPAQNTLLGKFRDRIAVLCEDFMQDYPPGFQLQEFKQLENSFLEDAQIGRTPYLETINAIFQKHPRLEGIRLEAEKRYWDMFVLDAFTGNFDRHSGNWGYIVDLNSARIEVAPIYDCGSSLFPELDDGAIEGELADKEHMTDRLYKYPTAALIINGKRAKYHEVLGDVRNRKCVESLIGLYPRIDMKKISDIVDDTPLLPAIRKEFIKRILSDRYDLLLTPAYRKHGGARKDDVR
jgi:hypothetical protein